MPCLFLSSRETFPHCTHSAVCLFSLVSTFYYLLSWFPFFIKLNLNLSGVQNQVPPIFVWFPGLMFSAGNLSRISSFWNTGLFETNSHPEMGMSRGSGRHFFHHPRGNVRNASSSFVHASWAFSNKIWPGMHHGAGNRTFSLYVGMNTRPSSAHTT